MLVEFYKTVLVVLFVLALSIGLTYLATSIIAGTYIVDDWPVASKMTAPIMFIGMGMFVGINVVGLMDWFDRRQDRKERK